MSDISTWNTSASGNTGATPDFLPEGCPPSAVNDWARECQAAVRRLVEDAQWFNWGHTPTRIDNDTFTVPTDLTALYHAGRRLKVGGSATGYCTISSSSYSSPDTTVNVTMDSGNLPATLSTVYLSILAATNQAIPRSLLVDAGTVSDPSLAIQGDPNTGIASPGADILSLVAGGTEWIRADTAGVALFGGFRLRTAITPPTITSNQNDYNPTGIATAAVVRLSSDAARTITGLSVSTLTGRILIVLNVGSFNIGFQTESLSSSAANRFSFGATSLSLQPGGGMILYYDSTSSRWRCIGAAKDF